MASVPNTKAKALAEGALLLQRFGYEGFSFEDIAKKVGVRKQSLYVHFESKEALASELIEEYRNSLEAWTDAIASFKPEDQIRAWFERLYKSAVEEYRYCSLAACASDYNSLPRSAKKNLTLAFADIHAWILRVVEQGQKEKAFRRDLSADELAEMVLALGFGGQQMARLQDNPDQLKRRQQNVLKLLKG